MHFILRGIVIVRISADSAHTSITGIVIEVPSPLHYMPSGAAVRYIRIYGICSAVFDEDGNKASKTPEPEHHSAEYELKLMNIAAELSDDLQPGDTIEATVLHYSTPSDRYVAVDISCIRDEEE